MYMYRYRWIFYLLYHQVPRVSDLSQLLFPHSFALFQQPVIREGGSENEKEKDRKD
jgi:hypothetical protein